MTNVLGDLQLHEPKHRWLTVRELSYKVVISIGSSHLISTDKLHGYENGS